MLSLTHKIKYIKIVILLKHTFLNLKRKYLKSAIFLAITKQRFICLYLPSLNCRHYMFEVQAIRAGASSFDKLLAIILHKLCIHRSPSEINDTFRFMFFSAYFYLTGYNWRHWNNVFYLLILNVNIIYVSSNIFNGKSWWDTITYHYMG